MTKEEAKELRDLVRDIEVKVDSVRKVVDELYAVLGRDFLGDRDAAEILRIMRENKALDNLKILAKCFKSVKDYLDGIIW